ncbi:Dps family protein [Nocardia donostiensis]|uniref:DNA starvation/stationary phase protection protein n=1 Tax=Nocardia donostiensis TaxID=1538463 RepID=A0A1V2TEP5_9NOCA|nr:DNA starvation/stationary phase protection protein [Nocardia donostiensis]ONM47989.1 DNA starvation/stationary phase protection protein [Nocardia donostiensis]OQS13098.1 DNA starvation/stationary phase protection protein [Nocardia donostiensis]OQS21532.1 DNA starvation/stationary phase protection protein [Nocardia donostiensis]
MTVPIKSTLDPEQQRITGEALRGAVVDLIDLSLIAKQAHWNVVGTNFRSVHLALDELVTAAREFTDSAAERATAIGVSPDGRAATVAKEAGGLGFPDGWQQDTDVINAIVDNLATVIGRLRERIDATEKADPVTQDLFIEIAARLEQLHWMWQAQLTTA